MLRSIDHLLLRATIQQAKQNGIDNCTIMHGWILGYLSKHKNKDIYQKDIEKEFSITRSAVTSIVKKMESYGYIQRIEVEHDARLKKIIITKSGEEMHHKIIENFIKMDNIMFNGVSDEEYDVFLKVCHKLKDNLHSLL